MGFDRNPSFTYGGRKASPVAFEEDDELTRTYTDLLAIVDQESLSPHGPSKAMLNQVVAWVGLARTELVALKRAKVSERFLVLVERVKNLWILVIGQWAAILFLAGLIMSRK